MHGDTVAAIATAANWAVMATSMSTGGEEDRVPRGLPIVVRLNAEVGEALLSSLPYEYRTTVLYGNLNPVHKSTRY